MLSKALEDRKQDRYQSAAEFRDALSCSISSAPEVVAIGADLGTGECPSCRTKNESHRKFCRECAASLRMNCLSCKVELPVWDKVCPECGKKQAELVAARVAAMKLERQKAEELFNQYAFDEAIRTVQSIASETDCRLQQLKSWAETFALELAEEKTRQEDSALKQYADAKMHRKVFDYQSAIHAIESIPEPIRTREMSQFLVKLHEEHFESTQLLKRLADPLKRQELDGLRKQVDRAIELRGDDQVLRKLQMQLIKCDASCHEARQFLDEGKAKEALSLIQEFEEANLTRGQQALKSKLQSIVNAELKLTAAVKEANADGVIDPNEVVQLLQLVNAYLELNPRHEKIRSLFQQLIDRVDKTPSAYREHLASAKMPANVIEKFSSQVLAQLPPQVLSQLPPLVLAQLPPMVNTIGMQLKLLPAGNFVMGDGSASHEVTLTRPFYMGVTEVTQEHYQRVMGANPSKFKGAKNPVETVNWDDAVSFCKKLSEMPKEKAAGREYRLPTEAEWEYACRAGSTTSYSFGDSAELIGEYAWFEENAGNETHPVGEKKPNGWGLYDMHGNVWEWCQDWYADYSPDASTDPHGPNRGTSRVDRGGSWGNDAADCRAAYRGSLGPTRRAARRGFRLALSPSVKSPEAEQFNK